jgi:hypothetical protein
VEAEVCSSVAARLDMIFPSLKRRYPIYAEYRGFVTAKTHLCGQGINQIRRGEGSQKCEPGFHWRPLSEVGPVSATPVLRTSESHGQQQLNTTSPAYPI